MSGDYRAPLSLRLANRLYTAHFPTYRALYFAYKRFSDRRFIMRLREMVRPGMTVLDVGANIGFYTRLLSDLVGPDGAVHAFEPEERNFHRLREGCRQRSNATLNRSAVGAADGTVSLAISHEVNVDHHVSVHGPSSDSVAVPSTTLDTYCQGLKRLDLVKFDIQGGEQGAFLGMPACWRRFPRLRVFLEFWPYGLARSGSSGSALLGHFAEQGFVVEVIEGPSLAVCRDDAPPQVYNQLMVRAS